MNPKHWKMNAFIKLKVWLVSWFTTISILKESSSHNFWINKSILIKLILLFLWNIFISSSSSSCLKYGVVNWFL